MVHIRCQPYVGSQCSGACIHLAGGHAIDLLDRGDEFTQQEPPKRDNFLIGQGFYSVSPGPIAYPDDPRPAVREVLPRYKQRFGIDINYLGEATYAAACCTIEALQRAGRDLNLDTFRASMEQTKNWRDIFGGPPLTISPTDHHASTQSFLSIVKSGRWTTVVQEPLGYS